MLEFEAHHRPVNLKLLHHPPPFFFFQNGAKTGFEVYFDIGSQHLWCRGDRGSTKTRLESRRKKFKPRFFYRPAFATVFDELDSFFKTPTIESSPTNTKKAHQALLNINPSTDKCEAVLASCGYGFEAAAAMLFEELRVE